MRSNRTIQTIVQALTLVIVAAIFFRMPRGDQQSGGGGTRHGVPSAPSDAEIKQRYRAWFNEDNEVSTKAELLSVGVDDVCVDGALAYVKLNIELRWKGHNINYAKGPARGAPGQRGDTVRYTEVFKYRRWNKGWDLDERRKPPIIQ